MPLTEYPDPAPPSAPAVPPMTLYAVLRELSSIEADIAAYEATIARLRGRQTALMATAAQTMAGHPAGTVFYAANNESWQLSAGRPVRVETVDALTIDVPGEAGKPVDVPTVDEVRCSEVVEPRKPPATLWAARNAGQCKATPAGTCGPIVGISGPETCGPIVAPPIKHRASCLCPECLEVRENVSSFVDR